MHGFGGVSTSSAVVGSSVGVLGCGFVVGLASSPIFVNVNANPMPMPARIAIAVPWTPWNDGNRKPIEFEIVHTICQYHGLM